MQSNIFFCWRWFFFFSWRHVGFEKRFFRKDFWSKAQCVFERKRVREITEHFIVVWNLNQAHHSQHCMIFLCFLKANLFYLTKGTYPVSVAHLATYLHCYCEMTDLHVYRAIQLVIIVSLIQSTYLITPTVEHTSSWQFNFVYNNWWVNNFREFNFKQYTFF